MTYRRTTISEAGAARTIGQGNDRRAAALPAAVIALLIAVLGPGGARAADESAGALDSIWEDQKAAGAPVPASATSTSAPMCTVKEFQESSLVQKGGWPGVGPFKPGGGNPHELVDAGDNRLKIEVSGEKVTEAYLSLVKDNTSSNDLLDLQMSANFLLEAVGAKSPKIAEFNGQLEKNKDTVLLQSEAKPVTLSAGRYLVSIQKESANGTGRFRYSLRVNSRDISKDVLKQHSVAQGSSDGSGAPAGNGGAGGESPGSTTQIASTTAPPTDLLEEFSNVIKNWQRIKKSVTRNRHAGDLAEVLAGRALALQTEAVKWLVTNRKYWEMTLKDVNVEKYSELVPAKKYTVIAQVKQSRRFVDDVSGTVLKDIEDNDKVSYTVERLGDRWFITDYSIVRSTPQPQAVRPQPGKTGQ